jgi:hypothetical protein
MAPWSSCGSKPVIQLSVSFCALSFFILFLLPVTLPAQTRSWATPWDSGAFDVPGCTSCRSHSYLSFARPVVRSKHAVAVDAAGNVYLSGSSWNGSNYDAVVVKLSPAGVRQWMAVYDGGDEDLAFAVGLDAAGNAYITGHSIVLTDLYDFQPRLLVAKLDASGALQWSRLLDDGGVWSTGFSLVVDAAGNSFVAGESYSGDFISAVALSFGPTGNVRWSHYPFFGFDYEESSASDIALDASGNAFVTGYVYKPGFPDYTDSFVISRTSAGAARWARSYDSGGSDQGLAVATDPAGNAYVTGPTGTVKYSSAGAFQWAAPFGGTGHAVAADASAVYVTGISTGVSATDDFRTVRYDAATGAVQWNKTVDSGGSDKAYALALAGGRLWVAGPSNGDALTIAYDPATGAAPWSDRYDNGRTETAFALAVAPDGGVAVGGATGDDFLALRYAPPSSSVALKDLALAPGTFPGGCKSSTGKVTLTAPAPSGGAVVSLSNSNPVALLPASVTVLEGKTSASFPISAPAVSANQTGTVTASYGGVSDSETLKVRPVGVLSVTLGPSSVTGPGRVDGSVLLECAAGPSPIDVKLSSGSPTVAWPDQASLTIPAGSATGRFTVSAADVSTPTMVSIRATASGITKSAVLTVLP